MSGGGPKRPDDETLGLVAFLVLALVSAGTFLYMVSDYA